MPKINTFSSNSLKTLDKSLEEFKNKYLYSLYFNKKDKRSLLGEKFHSLISAYLNNIPIKKMLLELGEDELNIWQKLENHLNNKKQNFIKTEYSFLIKEKIEDKFYYLTGRMDAIYKENDLYTIYDWKTLNLPKDPENDLQTVVYLYSSSKIFKTKNIKMKYFSIEKQDFIEIDFLKEEEYKKRIDDIIKKYYKSNSSECIK